MSYPQVSSTQNQTQALPREATWEELSDLIQCREIEALSGWIDQSLEDLESRLIGFSTPNSRKKSLTSNR